MPRWAQDGGRQAMLKRLDNPGELTRIRPAMADNLRRRGGPASLLITRGPEGTRGKTLEAVATELRLDPIEAAIAVLKRGEAGVASFNQSEADIAAFMVRPWVISSSDASEGHPRYYASYARKYATYVKEKRVIDLRTFIDQSSYRAAGIFALQGRGQLKPGAYADVIAFDPKSFAPRADYTQPTLFSRGMRTVFVNGQLALEDGAPTGVAAGRPLPRTSRPGSCG
jgi:N-acyl-D-aspartate/D-glutamate deacylase